jgi:hypothetical protein
MGAIAIETKVKAIYYTKNLRKKYQHLSLCVNYGADGRWEGGDYLAV